jgi:hypothetical protein
MIVWVKDNGGMGTFYRSSHELIFAFKKGSATHINSFELGQHGRYRTNVWQYKGANSFGAGRDAALALHPTVKPVAMIADAIKDVSRRGGIVLDPFGGSGSTLIAAHKTGRRARLVEYDPIYCDRILARAEAALKDDAIQIACGWPNAVDVVQEDDVLRAHNAAAAIPVEQALIAERAGSTAAAESPPVACHSTSSRPGVSNVLPEAGGTLSDPANQRGDEAHFASASATSNHIHELPGFGRAYAETADGPAPR